MVDGSHLSASTRRKVHELMSLLPQYSTHFDDTPHDVDVNESLSDARQLEEFVLDPYVSPLFAKDLSG